MTLNEPLQLLVTKAQQADRAAFEELVERTREDLRVAIRSRLGVHLRHALDEDDLLQEVFTRALQAIKTFRWQGTRSFLAWLKAIADHVILKAARRQRREQLLLIRHQDQAGEGALVSPSQAARREERFERLQEALDSLTPEHREVIWLARIEGLRIRDIADRLNKSVPAIKGLLFRALKRLKESFGDTESLNLPDRTLDDRGQADG